MTIGQGLAITGIWVAAACMVIFGGVPASPVIFGLTIGTFLICVSN